VAITAVFVFDGNDVSAYPTIEAAAAASEVYDLKVLTYFTDDGTVLRATAEGYQVRLTPTTERRPDELRDRLRTHLQHPAVGLDPGLAEDPVSAAQALVDLHWRARPFQRFAWLDRRLSGTAPDPLHREAGA
jgi:hypothetical protein